MRPTIPAAAARAPSQVAVTPQPFKRAQFGLFQGRTKQYGNNVPFSLHKTRRSWLPNVQRKRLFSETLQSHVRVKVTTTALKTIKKKGGVDNYLMQTNAGLLGWKGMQLRISLRETQKKTVAAAADSPESSESAVKPARRPKKPLIPPQPESALKALGDPRTAAKVVRHNRLMAAKALGKPGSMASAEETIKYMKQLKIEQDKYLPRQASTKLPL
ncbi:Mitochondrial 50S ribosomal protein [Mycena venus]|uniref:Large ribosomal subunit protein bL28m n=1 Tax=Mycena venus TaxID=2733690 RepID=A0A8H6Y899_9AGAR|nr:Mitochondrial 50S ribosomal protein [Mycena venus]